MFLPGAVQAVLVMLWWVADMESRRAGLVPGGLPGPALHGWWMLYGFFPFFVFGFLFTAMPNWLNGPGIPRPAYLSASLLMMAGVLGVHGSALHGQFAPVGVLLHLAGWLVALAALSRTLFGAPQQDKRHAAAVTAAVLLGALGDGAFLAWTALDWPEGLAVAEALGLWGFLVPVFLAVCHRMIPWFTSRVVPNYVMIRPYGPLWVVLGVGAAHGALLVAALPELTWPLALCGAGIVFWFSARWGVARGVRQERLLAMLHIAFLWSGVALALYGADSLGRFAGFPWDAGQAPAHALGIGFFTTMLIGMASRVTLGHSGRRLAADEATWRLFWLVQATAALRMAPELVPALPERLASLAALLWLVALGAWAWKYAPMYWRPRVDGRPG